MQGLVRFGKYFGFVMLIGLVLQVLVEFDRVMLEEAMMSFDRLSYFVYLSLYPILIGILFAIPHLIRERKNDGKWTYDWGKGVAIGLPALFGATIFLHHYSPFGDYVSVLLRYKEFPIVSGIVLGYTALTSFHKAKGM
ncbi:hypothetical protein [uncultured Brevibacillus sp.]|uniref:hypothetical protein n=1 Tax=uncultured Brevibacillus sp. TaxID=169970 RepID=UPI002592271D|nr:hypothetical protein [uncultured Brevibacillus sp.]